ncbi:MAG: hypothetical protein JSS14_22065 [Proteobacteria bacterium]|nr:hypothetical protein [Pseudomonadota bacterium]
MKLRLFALRDTRTNKTVPELHFPNKPEARAERDARNRQLGEGLTYVVTYGPDHRHYR